MTRYRDMMCEDIFGCDHELEIPVTNGADVIYWRCRCGAKRQQVAESKPANTRSCPLCHGKGWAISVDAIEADGQVVNPRQETCIVCEGLGVVPARAGENP